MSSSDAIRHDCRRIVMIAAPATWTNNVKARIARAARVLGLTPRRTKSLYYLEAKVIPADEYMRLKQIEEEISQRAQEVRDHHEYLRSLAVGSVALARQSVRAPHQGDPTEAPASTDVAAGRPAAADEEF